MLVQTICPSRFLRIIVYDTNLIWVYTCTIDSRMVCFTHLLANGETQWHYQKIHGTHLKRRTQRLPRACRPKHYTTHTSIGGDRTGTHKNGWEQEKGSPEEDCRNTCCRIRISLQPIEGIGMVSDNDSMQSCAEDKGDSPRRTQAHYTITREEVLAWEAT